MTYINPLYFATVMAFAAYLYNYEMARFAADESKTVYRTRAKALNRVFYILMASAVFSKGVETLFLLITS